MNTVRTDPEITRLGSAAGLTAELNANGSLRRLQCGPVCLSLFPGSLIEGGPANLYLRRLGQKNMEWTALLGPRSPSQFSLQPLPVSASAALRRLLIGSGHWAGIDYWLELALGEAAATWAWRVWLRNASDRALTLDLTYVQDLALAPYGAVRMNEYYVSQYIDHTPLQHQRLGVLVASRQNQAVEGRYPWSLIGSLRSAVSYATDALQWYDRAARSDTPAPGLLGDLPGQRLQHEHSMVVLRDAPLRLQSGQTTPGGFVGLFLPDHPAATSPEDLRHSDELLPTLSWASSPAPPAALTELAPSTPPRQHATLFTVSPLLVCQDADETLLHNLFPGPWRHEEHDEQGMRLSFFQGEDHHVVLRAKELRALRPHGQLLRTGLHLTPDEQSQTSTVWMAGAFHSMVAQGHVSINRCLSAVHSYLGLFRAQGQRVFIEIAGVWRLLGVPSAFEMSPQECRWIYQHEQGLIEVRSGVLHEPQCLTLSLQIRAGPPARFLIVHHVALNGDDGALRGAALWQLDGQAVQLTPASGSDLARRFPNGRFIIAPVDATLFERIGGDELLFLDGQARGEPYVCLITAATSHAQLRLEAQLIEAADARSATPLRTQDARQLVPMLVLQPSVADPTGAAATRLAEIAPWFAQNAWVHYLSPRGLEQYSGGGWGTRDVCQGPVELLLALGHTGALRDVLLRVYAQQNPDGDWPQWFMIYERERAIRAGDSHGDIALWPLVVLAQYLRASGDATVLEQPVPFFTSRSAAAERATVWQHAQRALALIEQRLIPGTALVSYGHGDWNDSLQPVDTHLREHLCSAWTVTLHVQALTALAHALRAIGRERQAQPLVARAGQVRADFQRLLLVDGVLAGYALFEPDGQVSYLLHPRDERTGVHYSALAMIHAMLEDLFSPAQARAHLALIEARLSASDGVRLFDQPLPYHGGPQRLFQRAESATFFGREIGLMYTHAHLRYAQALAHMGESELFFRALCQANPIGLSELVHQATLRQANCYYSSSDAAFADRYQASAEYARVAEGSIALNGGWRVYSSGAGIGFGLLLRRFLGLTAEASALLVDPVMPPSLDGLHAQLPLLGHIIDVHYRVGPTGCGVQRLQLNDTALTFEREPNPHRLGAARVSKRQLETLLRTASNQLHIELGGAVR